MADIKMINNYYIKDETARNEIKNLRDEIPSIEGLATKDELNDAIGDINTILDNINGEEI